ncbi:MAG TPA: peptidoglycan DD-metalloendopeptidase family protein [Burkholderiaceae bacterium]|jgi:septal ring factor EnvC (AmiA/AmiB activator)|nr:peptidoglycan DD-metalloendopeptidase family protein [Burkholderiaceae bacterium]
MPVACGAVALALACASAAPCFAKGPEAGGQSSSAKPSESKDPLGGPVSAQRKSQLQGEQRDLRARLVQLKKRLAESEAAHSEASDALAESETAISAANRRLRELGQARRQVETQISALQERERNTRSRQGSHELAVAQLIRTQFALEGRRPWQQLIDGTQPGGAARERLYLDRIIHAEVRQIGDLRQRHDQLVELESQSREQRAELASIAAEETTSRTQLLSQQASHKATLARLSREIAAQRRSVAELEQDEARLGSLIDQISRLLAEQARKHPPARPPTTTPVPRGEAPSLAAFGALRGKLELPVQGQLGARFGAPRRDEDGQPQAGAPTWKGLFIRAQAGAEVHAIAAGRVVFADWLRGFGNLMILDHGNGLLSVYGNNETLLRGIGDLVQAREVIAAVGSTGGSQDSGLYFELRYQGKPFDPLAWVGPR